MREFQPMSDAELEEIERIWAAAAPPPWNAPPPLWSPGPEDPDMPAVESIACTDGTVISAGWDENLHSTKANLTAIVSAPEHVARLLAEVKMLRKEQGRERDERLLAMVAAMQTSLARIETRLDTKP